MWLFPDIQIAWYSVNLGTIIDIVIILLIISVTIYETRRKNKWNGWKGSKYIDGKIWIDEKEWFIVETNVKKNIEKYNEIKWFFGAAFLIPSLLLITLVDLFWLWYSIYKIIINGADNEIIISLIIFFIGSLLITFIFIKVKKTLGDFFYKLLKIIGILFLSLIILVCGWFIASFIDKNLESNDWLWSFIALLFFWLFFLWFVYFYFKIFFKFFTSKKESLSNWNDNPMDNKITDEWIDKEIKYEDLLDGNKKLEEETWFHQWSLLK